MMESIRGFVTIRTDGRSGRRCSGQLQPSRGLLDRAREWHSAKVSEKAEKEVKREEGQRERWREQLRRNIEVKKRRQVL